MLTIYDRTGHIVAHLTNQSPDGVPYWDDEYVNNSETGEVSFVFTTPLGTSVNQYLTGLNRLSFVDEDEEELLFTIIKVDENSDRANPVAVVYCEGIQVTELNSSFSNPYRGNTFQDCIKAVLSNTLWTYKDYSGIKAGAGGFESTETQTALAALLQLQEQYDVVYSFTCVSDGTKITQRVVNIYSVKPIHEGKYFIYDRDLVSVERVVDYTNLCTAIIPVSQKNGNGVRTNLIGYTANIDDKNFTKAKTDNYIVSKSALREWGVEGKNTFGLYVSSTSGVTQAGLVVEGIEELKKRSQPDVSYTVNVLDLEALGFQGEDVHNGDTVWVKDNTFNPPLGLEATVIELRKSSTNPETNQITFGKFIPINVQDVPAIEAIKGELFALNDSLNNASSANIMLNADFRSEYLEWEFPQTASTVVFPQAEGLGEIQNYCSLGWTSPLIGLDTMTQEVRSPNRLFGHKMLYSWYERGSVTGGEVTTTVTVTYMQSTGVSKTVTYSDGLTFKDPVTAWVRRGFLVDFSKLKATEILSVTITYYFPTGMMGGYDFTGTMFQDTNVSLDAGLIPADEAIIAPSSAPPALLKSSLKSVSPAPSLLKNSVDDGSTTGVLVSTYAADVNQSYVPPEGSWKYGDPALTGTNLGSIMSQSANDILIQSEHVTVRNSNLTLDNSGITINGGSFRIVDEGLEQLAQTASNFLADPIVSSKGIQVVQNNDGLDSIPVCTDFAAVNEAGVPVPQRTNPFNWYSSTGTLANARLSIETPFPSGYSLAVCPKWNNAWYQSLHLRAKLNYLPSGASPTLYDTSLKNSSALTVSFWAKTSNVSTSAEMDIRVIFRTLRGKAGANPDAGADILAQVVPITSEWTRYAFTWDSSVDDSFDVNDTDMRVMFSHSSTTTDNTAVGLIAGIQLVSGTYPAIFQAETTTSAMLQGFLK
ncbi:minor structural protein [Listeria phage LP-KV022]|uniref:Minor structural protein n=2 Tax=Homburgvirus LP110 TaxID=1921128 RepID=A0A5A4K4F6_9CAUD|nr:tail protein [Listeria phage LP-110]AGI11586.1 minor structural protein [Listeria phage LP-110]AWY07665.1 minor structural protein [Listeria phage LP-KV022]